MADTRAYQARLMRVASAAIKAGYDAAEKSAREIGGAMKSAVPRDEGVLAQSIRLETNPAAGRVRILAGGAATTRPVRNGASATYDYAMAQEYGTQEMPAHPFFWPAWRGGKKRARANINRAMKRAIEDTA